MPCFCKIISTHGLLHTADAVRGKVVFCDEYGAGVYYVLDCSGAEARREIVRNAPPQVIFFTKNKTLKKRRYSKYYTAAM